MIEDAEIAMETDEVKKEAGKKYCIDTNSLRVPRKGMEVQTFLKDGMSKINNFLRFYEFDSAVKYLLQHTNVHA